MEKEISIIMPTFNSENTISRAIECVISQLNNEKELIIVDDGSTDRTKEIIKSYKEKCSYIRLIECTHLGVSHSRNIGIEASCGKFIMFIDADDLYTNNTISCFMKFFKKYKNIDVFISNFYKRIDNIDYPVIEEVKDYKNLNSYFNISKTRKVKNYFLSECAMGSVWRCAFKRKFLLSNNIKFNEELRLNEDLLFLLKAISMGNIMHINKYTYIYVNNTDSVVNENYKRNLLQNRLICLDNYKFYFDNNMINEDSFYRCNYIFAYEIVRNEIKKGIRNFITMTKCNDLKKMNTIKSRNIAIKDKSYKEYIILTLCSIFFEIKGR